MISLREAVAEAEKNKRAIGHFNISNIETLWGIFFAARALNVPVIVGVSEGERDFLGMRQAAALVKSLREEFDYPVFLNADHSYSFERVKDAIDVGFDAVIFDGAKLSLDENIKITRQCVEYARSARHDVLVEGEIGYIGTSSKLLDEIPRDVHLSGEFLTKPEDAYRFIDETEADLLAPAIGNIHGMLKAGKNPALDISRIVEIKKTAHAPIVLHGGSGISDEDFRNAIEAGVSIIHINTELRVAYRRALELNLEENRDEVAPYKYMKGVVKAIQDVVEKRLRLFSNL